MPAAARVIGHPSGRARDRSGFGAERANESALLRVFYEAVRREGFPFASSQHCRKQPIMIPKHRPMPFVEARNLPSHVGIIMDGNGRWASRRGEPRIEGHRRGARSVKEVVRAGREFDGRPKL